VFNIFAHEVATGRALQVTNVLGGAFEPVPSHDGSRLAYIGFTSNGYDLWVMKLDPEKFFAPPPAIDDKPAVDDPSPELAEDRGRSPTLRSRRYQPIRTMFPRTISPSAIEGAQSGSFGGDLGASLGLADVLGFHSLLANVRYQGAPFNQPAGSVQYEFARLLPTFRVGFGRSYAFRGNQYSRYVYDQPDGATSAYQQVGYREQITQFNASIGVPVVRHPIHDASASLAYSYTHFASADKFPAVDPNAPASTVPELGGMGQVTLRFDYSNARGVRYGYASETGRAATVAVSLIDPHLGGKFSDVWVTGAYTEYIRMPWRGHQVLALRLSAAASAGGLGRRAPYAIGGFSPQNDVIRSFLLRSAYTEVGALRGFRPGAYDGDYYTVLNAEYRIPLADVERGIRTLPAFMRRITMIPFVDVGGAWYQFTRQAIKFGAGASLVTSFKLGYGDSIDVLLQYARGFDPENGLNYFRAAVARSF
jgi:hypothetical protein